MLGLDVQGVAIEQEGESLRVAAHEMIDHDPKLPHELFLSIDHQAEVLPHGFQSEPKVVCGMLGLEVKYS